MIYYIKCYHGTYMNWQTSALTLEEAKKIANKYLKNFRNMEQRPVHVDIIEVNHNLIERVS